MSAARPSYALKPPKRIGGRVCLDFVNTVEWRGDRTDRGERLTDYSELLHWSAAQNLLGPADLSRLQRASERSPTLAGAALAEATALREALARLLPLSRGQKQPEIRLLNDLLERAPPRRVSSGDGIGFSWHLETVGEELAWPLWPIAWDAADLLTSEKARRVRRCADRRCGWLFLDSGRGQGRRWCSMEGCGNRAKARRHYAKTKGRAKTTIGQAGDRTGRGP